MYYGSKLSEHMTKTPDDFLICHSVPIGRIGVQEYLGQEIGLAYGQRYEVERTEAEVFSAAAMASFEGKPFTNEHPPEEVTPDNASRYIKGTVKDVHRGQGEQEDLLLADIIVYDRQVIEQIEQGKREVSCGYECQYEPQGNNRYKQTHIVGNHVALVQKGRAGARVAIKDALPKQRRDNMSKHTKQGIWGKMIQAFAQDATPEEMEMAVDEMAKACGDEEPAATSVPVPTEPTKEPPVQDEGPNPLEERLAKVEAMLVQLVQAMQPKQEPDALDALEQELTAKEQAPATDEESATVEPEQVEEARAAADSAALLGQIAALKPVVAQIKDPIQRKKTSDTLAGILRQGVRTTPAASGAYADLYQAARQNAQTARKAADAAADESSLGKEIAAKYNPHYQKEAK